MATGKTFQAGDRCATTAGAIVTVEKVDGPFATVIDDNGRSSSIAVGYLKSPDGVKVVPPARDDPTSILVRQLRRHGLTVSGEGKTVVVRLSTLEAMNLFEWLEVQGSETT